MLTICTINFLSTFNYVKAVNNKGNNFRQPKQGGSEMNIGEILGALVQAGMSQSSSDRMRNSLGGGSVMDSLAGMIGGASQNGGGIADVLSGMLGGGSGSGGGITEILSGMLGDAGRAVGGKQNLALGGLGALIGSLLGGGGKSVGGALGGGLMALLGAMAFNALKGSGEQKPQILVGLLEPQTEAEKKNWNRIQSWF